MAWALALHLHRIDPPRISRGRVGTFADVDATSAGQCSSMHLIAVADEDGEAARRTAALQLDVHIARLLPSGSNLTANHRTPGRLASSRGLCLPASGVGHLAGLISSRFVLRYSGSATRGRGLLANPFGQVDRVPPPESPEPDEGGCVAGAHQLLEGSIRDLQVLGNLLGRQQSFRIAWFAHLCNHLRLVAGEQCNP